MDKDKDTKPLFLDERMAAGMELESGRSRYPALPGDVSKVLDLVAEQLLIAKSAMQWAWFDLVTKGDKSGFRRVRERLLSRSVKAVKK